MKKLIMTAVAALGFAALAQAGVLNSTGFEDYDDNDNEFAVNTSDWGSPDTGTQYWTGTGDFSQTELKTYGEDVVEPTNLPDDFETAGDYFLSVDTGNDVMYRKAGSDAGSVDLTQGAVFFDANVKFTASETAVVPSAGDKLLVWLKGDETTTNLVVTANVTEDEGETWTNTNFEVDGAYAADTWYRLTVKADKKTVGEKEVAYFNVYINGVKVAAKDTQTTDFYSLVTSGTEKTKLEAAGFQGTGALDNVVWTTTDPFYVETEEFTVNVTLTDDGGAVGGWTFNGEDAGGETEVTANIEVAVDAEIVVTLTVYESVTVAATIDGETVADANITSAAGEEEATIYTITLSGAGYADGDTVVLAITVTKSDSPTPEDTTEINADGKGYVADETGSTYTKAAVEAMVIVVAPNADSLSDEAKAAYDGYFTKNATYNTETKKWEVAVTLDTVTLEADVDDAVEAALEAVVGDAETKAVEIPAGFYYKIEHGATVGLTGEPLTGTSTGSVAMPVLGEDAGFFKVSVGTTTFAE